MMFKLEARAKINLTLEILGKRPDGYHELRTVFQTLRLSDELVFLSAPETLEIECSSPWVPQGEENLIYRAASALARYAKRSFGAKILLKKRIPVGAGLGGGSADAAAALVGLSRLWGLDLSMEELLKVACDIGADVAFALLGGTALGEGRGEILTPLPALAEFWTVIVQPDFQILAHDAYGLWDRRASTSGGEASQRMIEAITNGDLRAIASCLHNDFEETLFPIYPDLARIKEALLGCGCLGALLCGSGSCVFGIAESFGEIKRIAAIMQRRSAKAVLISKAGGSLED